jgi:hypothetical protein
MSIVKLTKKQFIEKLENTRFITSIYNRSAEEINDALYKTKYKLKGIYTVNTIEQKSNYIRCIEKNGSDSRRDFFGKNDFYMINDFIVHRNIQNNDVCYMINQV